MEQNKNLSYCTCQTSASHTFGNVTACVQKWLLDLFPRDTFKTVHIHSKLAHRQLTSTSKEFLKKSKPMLIMRPRVNWDDTSLFLKDTMITERTTDLYNSYAGSNLQPFVEDHKNKFRIKYQLNRNCMQFDVIMIFSTLMEQMNWVSYIKNAVRSERPFFISTHLESYLAPEMMNIISECCGIPVHDENNSVRAFMDYLNGHSAYPITYKLQGSTNREEFFRYYATNIDTTITNIAVDDGDRNGQISTNFQVTFSIRAEFYSTGFYYIFSPSLKNHNPITIPDNAELIPIFTDIIYHEDVNLDPGWRLVAHPMCKLENQVRDKINFQTILNSSVKYAIKYHLEHGMPLDMLINIRIRKQGDMIANHTDYEIDYNTYEITFFNGSIYHTYGISIYVNIQYINELIKEIYNLA